MTSTTLPLPAGLDLAARVERRAGGYPLESTFYTSPAVFDLDVTAPRRSSARPATTSPSSSGRTP